MQRLLSIVSLLVLLGAGYYVTETSKNQPKLSTNNSQNEKREGSYAPPTLNKTSPQGPTNTRRVFEQANRRSGGPSTSRTSTDRREAAQGQSQGQARSQPQQNNSQVRNQQSRNQRSRRTTQMSVPRNPKMLRIASYNIEVFGKKKAGLANGKVLNALANIIRWYDIVAIQEIRSKDPAPFLQLMAAINSRGAAKYNYILGPRLGRTYSKEQYAFIYNTETVLVNPNVQYTISDPDDLLHREPLVAQFRARKAPSEKAFTFVLVNVHTDPDETKGELDALAQVHKVVKKQLRNEDDVILIGDFNFNAKSQIDGSSRALGGLRLIQGIQPLVTTVATNTAGNRIHDNIMIQPQATLEFHGVARVEDLIGDGYSATNVEALSNHLPIWADFSIYENHGSERVADRSVSP